MRFGLLGEKLGHSYSPELHAFFGDYEYELFEVAPDQLGDFIRNGDFQGLNVTIPYKTTMLALCDDLTEAAAAKLSAVDEGARVEDKTAAKALVDQARGGVSEVSSLASESIVKAPAAGEVTRIVMEEGEVAPAGFPLVLVTDLSDKWVVFNIREDELPGVEVGTILKGFIPAVNRTVDLKVNWINPRGEYAVWRATRQSTGYDLRTFEVRARPVEELPALRPGMTVIVER